MTEPGAGERRLWSRYVAIGDSFTEGMSDDDPLIVGDGSHGEFAGWADRLAAHLSELAQNSGLGFGYANLAVRGRKLSDVVGPQLEKALALEPDLVSIVGGGNDILRPKADLDALASRLEDAVKRIRAKLSGCFPREKSRGVLCASSCPARRRFCLSQKYRYSVGRKTSR